MSSQQDGNDVGELGTARISSLYARYSLAALSGLVAQITFVICDGFFVGNGVGETGLAAVSIVYPLWVVALSLGGMIGIDASSLAAIKKGEGKMEEARRAIGQGFWYSFCFSILIALICYLFMDQVIGILGVSSGDVFLAAQAHQRVFLIGFPFIMTGFVMFYFIRVDEKPLQGTVFMVGAALLGIVVEYTAIFHLHLGMAGAALGWITSYAVMFPLLGNFIFGKTSLKIRLCDIKPDFRLIGEISRIGFACFLIQISVTIVSVVINQVIGVYGTGTALASCGVLNVYIVYILSYITISLVMGLQPIASYNFGARLYGRVRQILLLGTGTAIAAVAVGLVLVFIFNRQFIALFTGDSEELFQTTNRAVQMYICMLPPGSVAILASGYFQAVESNWRAVLNGTTRVLLFTLPLVLILSYFVGLTGGWLSQPVADVMAFLVAGLFIRKESRKLQQLAVEQPAGLKQAAENPVGMKQGKEQTVTEKTIVVLPEPDACMSELSVPFPMQEYQNRLDKIRLEMQKRKVELLYVTMPEHLFYVSGYDCSWFRGNSPRVWYDQTVTGIAMKYGMKQDPSRWIHCFETYAFGYMLDCCIREMPPHMLYPPAPLQLMDRHGQAHGEPLKKVREKGLEAETGRNILFA